MAIKFEDKPSAPREKPAGKSSKPKPGKESTKGKGRPQGRSGKRGA